MKIAILTWAANTNNYGSILQAYALQRFLDDNGYDSIILDYRWNANDLKWPSEIEITRRKIATRIKNHFNEKSDRLNQMNCLVTKSCLDFRHNNMKISHTYRGIKELKASNKEYDTFICGSDQIWSMKEIINPAYYLTWVSKEKKKIAYAPSMPMIQIDSKRQKALKEFVCDFTAVSVREEKTAEMMQELLGQNIISTLDPTLLIDEKVWFDLTTNNNTKEKYILCYFLGKNKNYEKCVQRIAKETNHRVIVVPTSEKSFEFEGDIKRDVGPIKFLNLIRNASIVMTDSYHASIFSVIFKKQFVLFKRFIDGNKDDENGRIYDLVTKLSLYDQLADAENFDLNKLKKPNYNLQDEKLELLRKESKDFLLSSLVKEDWL